MITFFFQTSSTELCVDARSEKAPRGENQLKDRGHSLWVWKWVQEEASKTSQEVSTSPTAGPRWDLQVLREAAWCEELCAQEAHGQPPSQALHGQRKEEAAEIV